MVPLARCYQPPAPPPAQPLAFERRPAAMAAARRESESTPPRKLKLESEDSSYDSDCETPLPDHEDVSRTVSDTLGAEFDEYVSTGGGETGAYNARVEFACKLGYTEEHVQRALRKLGGHPGENDFLEELIRVGKDAKASGDVEDFEDASSSAPVAAAKVRLAREATREEPASLRHIVVDGSNVAMSHGNKERFSCRGIRLAVEYFGREATRASPCLCRCGGKRHRDPTHPSLIKKFSWNWNENEILVFTPSRVVDGKRITCYDDRYILQTALDQDGVVVSNDNYRDLHKEKPFKKIIEERILMYSFANDKFMPPDDPLGRNGPTLDNFLRKSPRPSESLCPYGKKCTYGNKCKYYHPERGNQPQKTVTEKLAEHAQRSLQGRRGTGDSSQGGRSVRDKTLSLPGGDARVPGGQVRKQPVSRTRSLVPGSVPADSRPPLPDDSQLRAAAKSRSMENVSCASRLRSVPIDPASYDPAAAAAVAPAPGDWPHWGVQQSQQHQQPHVHDKTVRQHLELCRKSSDPSYQSSHEPPRAHKPLARQLTLNPAYDPRLAQRDQYVLELQAQLGRQHQLLASRSLLSPHWDGGQQPTAQHASVTRIASAPDSGRQSAGAPPPPPHGYSMQRLSSTSDPQLNAFPYQYQASAADPAWHRPATSSPSSGWPSVSAPAHSQPPPPQTFNLFQPNPLTASLSTPPLGGATSQAQGPGGASVSPAGGAQFNVLGFGATGGYTPDPIGTQPSSPRQSKEEQRRRMYWHLSALFPEENVRVAMNLMPDETDATKICAEILHRN